MAGKQDDDPTMSWMSDEEYLAAWRRNEAVEQARAADERAAEHERRLRETALPQTVEQLHDWLAAPSTETRRERRRQFHSVPADVAEAQLSLVDRCPGCARPVIEAKEPPISDGRQRWWHRECARRALGELPTAHAAAVCPGCGRPPPARGFLFDAERRRWHVEAECTGRALAPLERDVGED